MKHLMIGAAAIALLAGCQNEDNGSASYDAGIEITARAGNPAEAENALVNMSLTKTGKGLLTFADRTVDGASAEFTNLSLVPEDSITLGSLTLEGLDMVDGAASFAVIRINDVAVSDVDDLDIRIDTIELVNPSPALTAWVAGMLYAGDPGDFPGLDEIQFGSWSLEGLNVDIEDGREGGNFAVTKMEILGLGDDTVGHVGLQGLALSFADAGEEVEVKVGQLGLSNIDTNLLFALSEDFGDPEDMAVAMMEAVYSNPMEPGYDAARLKDVSLSFGGVGFSVPSVDSSVERNAAGQPVKYVTKPYAMSLTADAGGGEPGEELAEALSMVGFQEISLKGESVGTYDPDLDIIEFKSRSNYLELVDGARFSFGGKIEGYSAYAAETASAMDFTGMAYGMEPDPMAMAAALGKITIHDLEFAIKDDGLVNRILGLIAVQTNTDPEALKSQVSMGLSMAPMMASSSGIDMALVTELATAVGSFIADPLTLRIALEPAEPLSLAGLIADPDPATITKDRLGFSAANK